MNSFLEEIHWEATQATPFVATDARAGTLEMRGDSYPENSFEFFKPIIQWMTAYLKVSDDPLCLHLNLVYLNTSSVKVMMDIFEMLEDAHDKGRAVSVRWLYDRDNERIAELAEEFKEDCTFPFEIAFLDE